MTFLDGIITWIHLLCAAIWVGGSIFLGIVLTPVLNTITKSPQEKILVMIKIGRRFNKIALPSFIILMITGIYNSHSFIEQPQLFFNTHYGIILIVKIILVIITFILYLIHIMLFSKKIEQNLVKNSEEYFFSIRSKIINLGRITVITSVIIILLAAMLDTGV